MQIEIQIKNENLHLVRYFEFYVKSKLKMNIMHQEQSFLIGGVLKTHIQHVKDRYWE